MSEQMDPTFYRSPAAAIAAPPEGLAYVAAFDPDGVERDAMAVVDCDGESSTCGEVVGWAALSPASKRRCYAGVAENSVYVAREAQGLGIGRALLEALIAGAEAAGIWTIQTSIFPENRGSLALHQKCGFRVVGTRERIAKRDGVWRDTVFLERRSEVIT